MTWSATNGIRLYLNGVILQVSTQKPQSWSPDYEGLTTRLIVGRYASDVISEWRATGYYAYGQLSFSDFLYVSYELQPFEVAPAIGLVGKYFVLVFYPILQHAITSTLRAC